MSIIMNTLTHNLLSNHEYELSYGAIPLLQQKHRRLSSQDPAHPSLCPLTGLDSTILNPHLPAGFICSGIGNDNSSYIDFNCTNENANGGNVTSELFISCQDADTFYKHEANTSDLEMLASWWIPQCCFTKSDIQKYWWDELQDFREGPSLSGLAGKLGIIVRGVMGMISVISSFTFIWMLRRSHDGLSTTMNRVLLGLCVSDIIYSCTSLHFGMFVPKELDYWSWNARGNMATCYIAGFFFAVGGALGPFYNASLCVLLLAIVKYEKSDEYIRKKIEPFLHAVPLLVAFGAYIFALAMGNINPNGAGTCGVTLYTRPPHCSGMENGSVTEGLFDIPCGRGNSKATLSSVLFGLIIPPIVMITCLTMIYRCVLITEKKMSKYGARSILNNETSSTSLRIPGLLKKYLLLKCSSSKKGKPATNSRPQQRNRKRPSNSRLVLYKGVAYSCSWLLSWGSVFMMYFFVMIGVDVPMGVLFYPITFVLPLQGLFNLAIYMHPKILAAKRSKRENLSWWKAFEKAFWSKGVGKNKKKGSGSGPRVISDYAIRYKSDSNIMKGGNGICGTAESRSLRSKSRRRTGSGEEEEEKQEIQAPRDVTYLSFGRRSTGVSTRENPTPSILICDAVHDVVVEDKKIETDDVNENDPDTIVKASTTSDGTDEVLELMEPNIAEGIDDGVSYFGNAGNDEEIALSKTNDDQIMWDAESERHI